MKIDKAIENLTPLTRDAGWIIDPDLKNAIELGIEALKGIKAVRQLHPELSPFPLPGETKD